MEPRMCLSLHNPPKSYGDCVRACIATLTDDDEVPHVFGGDVKPEESWRQLREYLKTKNKFLLLVSVEDPFEQQEEDNHGIPFMLMCRTLRGDHAVICQSGEVVHHPDYYPAEIIGPSQGMDYWVIGVVGNLV